MQICIKAAQKSLVVGLLAPARPRVSRESRARAKVEGKGTERK